MAVEHADRGKSRCETWHLPSPRDEFGADLMLHHLCYSVAKSALSVRIVQDVAKSASTQAVYRQRPMTRPGQLPPRRLLVQGLVNRRHGRRCPGSCPLSMWMKAIRKDQRTSQSSTWSFFTITAYRQLTRSPPTPPPATTSSLTFLRLGSLVHMYFTRSWPWRHLTSPMSGENHVNTTTATPKPATRQQHQ